MSATGAEYDARYLAGILFFNEGDYFEAHEVWEAAWMDAAGQERRFYQGLIQTAVALFHFGNGNVRGAVKLFHSSRDYLKDLPVRFLGLDIGTLSEQMGRCFSDLLASTEGGERVELSDDQLPVLELDPSPRSWPNPRDFHEPDD